MKKRSAFTGRSQHTVLKQDHLRYVLDTHVQISKNIQRNNDWVDEEYFYADICAGDGGNDVDGSPIVFSNIQKKYDLNCKPIFVDKNPVTMGKMSRKLDNDKAVCICDYHENVMGDLVPDGNKLGILYFDPNGDPFNDYPKLLSGFYDHQSTQRIDCLLYFSGTTIKRLLKAPATNRDWRLIDDMDRIGKNHWLIREPVGKFQWSFLLGVNWTKFPDFKKIGFHKITSVQGQSILNKLNYTNKEIKELGIKIYSQPKQLEMFPEETREVNRGRTKTH